MSLTLLSQIYLITVAAMSIAGEHENFPSQVASGHTAAILREIHAMAFDASRSVKIAAKCPISSHRVAGPNHRCTASQRVAQANDLTEYDVLKSTP